MAGRVRAGHHLRLTDDTGHQYAPDDVGPGTGRGIVDVIESLWPAATTRRSTRSSGEAITQAGGHPGAGLGPEEGHAALEHLRLHRDARHDGVRPRQMQ